MLATVIRNYNATQMEIEKKETVATQDDSRFK